MVTVFMLPPLLATLINVNMLKVDYPFTKDIVVTSKQITCSMFVLFYNNGSN